MKKRTLEPWFVLGKNIDYNFDSITLIRKSIKNFKHQVQFYTNSIYELESCYTLNQELKELEKELDKLKSSIDDEKHEQFLKFWGIVGRNGYEVNYVALHNCRQQINKLIRAEFLELTKPILILIANVENKIEAKKLLISKHQSNAAPIIAEHKINIEVDEAKLIELESDLIAEVEKLKSYLKTLK
jgi:alanyl-tRNA synthetase